MSHTATRARPSLLLRAAEELREHLRVRQEFSIGWAKRRHLIYFVAVAWDTQAGVISGDADVDIDD